MEIILNGKNREVPCQTVAELVTHLGMKQGMSSVWLNGRQLLRAEYEKTILRPGDKLTVKPILFGG